MGRAAVSKGQAWTWWATQARHDMLHLCNSCTPQPAPPSPPCPAAAAAPPAPTPGLCSPRWCCSCCTCCRRPPPAAAAPPPPQRTLRRHRRRPQRPWPPLPLHMPAAPGTWHSGAAGPAAAPGPTFPALGRPGIGWAGRGGQKSPGVGGQTPLRGAVAKHMTTKRHARRPAAPAAHLPRPLLVARVAGGFPQQEERLERLGAQQVVSILLGVGRWGGMGYGEAGRRRQQLQCQTAACRPAAAAARARLWLDRKVALPHVVHVLVWKVCLCGGSCSAAGKHTSEGTGEWGAARHAVGWCFGL